MLFRLAGDDRNGGSNIDISRLGKDEDLENNKIKSILVLLILVKKVHILGVGLNPSVKITPIFVIL